MIACVFVLSNSVCLSEEQSLKQEKLIEMLDSSFLSPFSPESNVLVNNEKMKPL